MPSKFPKSPLKQNKSLGIKKISPAKVSRSHNGAGGGLGALTAKIQAEHQLKLLGSTGATPERRLYQTILRTAALSITTIWRIFSTDKAADAGIVRV